MRSRDRATALILHHEKRLNDTLAAVVGSTSALDVASALRWTKRERLYSKLELHNRAFAVVETQFHLQLLEAEDRVCSKVTGGVRRYSRTD